MRHNYALLPLPALFLSLFRHGALDARIVYLCRVQSFDVRAGIVGNALPKLSAQEELIDSWYWSPSKFISDVWPDITLEKWQIEACALVAKNPRCAFRSGHGVGKTAWLAMIMIWWLSTRSPAKVGCTAPSSSQMFDALWSELGKWHQRMPAGLRDRLEWKTERMEVKDLYKESFAVAKTARRETPDALAGLHSENMLYLIDEAAGVDDIIFETARGAMSTLGAKTIMTGNPTRRSGYFFDAFHKNRAHWKTMRVSCMESSRTNVAEIQQWKEEYGEDSNFFRVRALGEFPTAEDDVIIPMYLVEDAVTRDVGQIDSEEIWGLDVSRGSGDFCALAKRRGNIMPEPVKVWRSDDAMVTVGKVVAEYQSMQTKPALICVDAVGLGAPVADRLAEQGLPVQCINVSESHSSNDRMLRVRDEMWERTRAWFFARDCKIAKDEAFVGEISLIKWHPTSNGKMKVMTKAEMKLAPPRGIGKSPDRSEAFCFTFMATGGGFKKQKPLNYQSLGLA